jgi:glycine/D-amino acid oxidase-like deaminating enzyme
MDQAGNHEAGRELSAGADGSGGPATLPYWWLDAPPTPAPEAPLPELVDVAIVGGGYCGLAAAGDLAAAGASVAVLERDRLGSGASSRNGGMVGGAVRLDFGALVGRYGLAQARSLRDEARASFEHLETLAGQPGIAADYERCGRFVAACSRAQFRRLQDQVAALEPADRAQVELVPRSAQRAEIGSDLYHGGVVVRPSGAVHPAKLLRGLRRRAEAAGANLHDGTAVSRLIRADGGFTVETGRGRLRAGQVIVATNGYTGPLTPELQRRIVPVGSYMIATEPLPEDRLAALSPKGRMFVDGNRLLTYFRLSPDGRRVLFGGRLDLRDQDERKAAAGLMARLVRVWPALAGVRLSHAWKGYLGFTFDRLPHLGRIAGVHYAMGCNGSGVAMATWLGHRLALKLLGRENRLSAFETVPFPGHALYRGRPWFLPLMGVWYRALDRLDRLRG